MSLIPLTFGKKLEAEEFFPLLLKANIFSKTVRSCSSCCLSSFNCKSHLPPYGSCQETSTRVKREISSHGDSRALLQIRVELIQLMGINYRKWAHTSSCSPSQGHVSSNRPHSRWRGRKELLSGKLQHLSENWEGIYNGVKHCSRISWLLMPFFPLALVRAGWYYTGMENSSRLTLLISNESLAKSSQPGMSSPTSAEESVMRQMYSKLWRGWNDLLMTTGRLAQRDKVIC